MTVQELRNLGYKVKVLHHRRHRLEGKEGMTQFYHPKGGITQIIVDSPSGDHFEGRAKCSDRDNYNKKLGVRIALGRCSIQDINITK